MSLLIFLLAPILLGASLIGYDFWAEHAFGNDATISIGMATLGYKLPLFAFGYGLIWGLLLGGLGVHFWARTGLPPTENK